MPWTMILKVEGSAIILDFTDKIWKRCFERVHFDKYLYMNNIVNCIKEFKRCFVIKENWE